MPPPHSSIPYPLASPAPPLAGAASHWSLVIPRALRAASLADSAIPPKSTGFPPMDFPDRLHAYVDEFANNLPQGLDTPVG